MCCGILTQIYPHNRLSNVMKYIPHCKAVWSQSYRIQWHNKTNYSTNWDEYNSFQKLTSIWQPKVSLRWGFCRQCRDGNLSITFQRIILLIVITYISFYEKPQNSKSIHIYLKIEISQCVLDCLDHGDLCMKQYNNLLKYWWLWIAVIYLFISWL